METIEFKAYPSYFRHKISFYLAADSVSINWGQNDNEERSLKGNKKHFEHKYSNHDDIQYVSIKATRLAYFSFDKGDCIDIEFGECPNLKEVICNDNEKLSVLTILNSENLERIECRNSVLTSLDLTNCVKLKKLDCSRNILSKLDLNKNILITELYCNNNSLVSLDITSNHKLINLDCSNNSLTDLTLSSNNNLEKLNCYNNFLESLDISHNILLRELYCSNNKLTKLDVSNNKILARFDCENNNFTNQSVKIKIGQRNILLNPISFSTIYAWEW